MTSDGSITHWIREIQEGNQQVAQELWERYFAKLVQLARMELRGAKRQMADEEDVAISVFDSFCRAAENGRFPDLADRDSLWRLLVRMTAQEYRPAAAGNEAASRGKGPSGIGRPADRRGGAGAGHRGHSQSRVRRHDGGGAAEPARVPRRR